MRRAKAHRSQQSHRYWPTMIHTEGWSHSSLNEILFHMTEGLFCQCPTCELLTDALAHLDFDITRDALNDEANYQLTLWYDSVAFVINTESFKAQMCQLSDTSLAWREAGVPFHAAAEV